MSRVRHVLLNDDGIMRKQLALTFAHVPVYNSATGAYPCAESWYHVSRLEKDVDRGKDFMTYRGAGSWYSPLKSVQIDHEHKGRAQRTVMTSISGVVNRLLAVLCLCSALRRLIHCNGWLLRVHTRRGNTLIRLVWERYIKDQLLHESQQDYLDMSPTRTLAGMEISVVIAGKQSMWIVVSWLEA